MNAPSNANTSGLEVVAWRSTWVGLTGRTVHQLHQQEAEAIRSAKWMESATFEPLVTAASAQARIAELEAERDEARMIVAWANNSLFGSHGYFHSLDGGPFNPHHLDDAIERLKSDSRLATAAEARADRYYDALVQADLTIRALTGTDQSDVEFIRAALQQETQP